ncbi:MAG: CO dehydrogenase/CO-methylating acetyl-CoA synthase complex subunit beta [Oscillospiraceae bacterium]|jgi:acetyl-CoA synthase|nr:CO dehydrogenase/CO-methylating acetyl-CoA synthase complex subunit beta [Oscillospiraceae bacterium]
MKLLFNRVFDGAAEMYAEAEAALTAAIAELGESAPMRMPDTAYHLACIYAYLGRKVTTLAELRDALADIKSKMTSNPRLGDVFSSGIGTALAAEVIEAVKYARTPTPYDGTDYHGHFSDAEVRELGVPLVTRDIPGFVVVIGPAPSQEEAVELIKGYQSRGIFVFLIGGVIQQALAAGVSMGFPLRVVPVGADIWSVGHIISVVVRAAMIFGNVQPGDWEEFNEYSFHRIFAFVNAYSPVPDITVACGGGAIAMGFPVITNETEDIQVVPKSLIIQENTRDFIETSLEARDIKIKVTNIDIPVAFSSAFEGEVVRRKDMRIDIDGSRTDCFELVRMRESQDVEDHKITVIGDDIDAFEVGTNMQLGTIVEVYGKAMQSDFEPVLERKFHTFLNCIEGVMHTGQRDMIRIRIANSAYDAGFRVRHLGEVLYAKIKSEYDTVVDKVQVTLITDPEKLKELRAEANVSYDARDARLKSLTDENVEVFYNCIMCQSFSPSHVCVVTPERLGLCGAVSWLDAKATNELDPNGPCQVVTKKRVIDENLGSYEDVNESVFKYSHGALEKVTLYSILEDPMTSCGCFECICGIEPMTNGVSIVNREHTGITPLGMTFSEMASMTGGGVQTPGFMGHGKHFIASKKFLKAEGGIARIVWMPADLKAQLRDKLNDSAQELYGIENFADLIGDENTVADGDPESLMNFLAEKGHPVLEMAPLM